MALKSGLYHLQLLIGNVSICFGQVGPWSYSLQASSQTLTLTVTSRASSATLPPITVTSKMNKDAGKFPSPMAVYAKIHQGSLPILRATVTAVIESVNGKTVTLELLDNGAGNHSKNWKTYLYFPKSSHRTERGHDLMGTVRSRESTTGGLVRRTLCFPTIPIF